ncbi:MAG: hypothetical protein ACFFBZ_15250 [Promethearchaeota archaeon]
MFSHRVKIIARLLTPSNYSLGSLKEEVKRKACAFWTILALSKQQ